MGRVRAADRDARPRALRLPEHRQARGDPRPGRQLRAAAATRRWSSLGLRTESFDGAALRERFAYLDADLGRLDVDAGVVDLPAVTGALMRRARRARGARRSRASRRRPSSATAPGCASAPTRAELSTRSLVVTAGHGTNDVLSLLPECDCSVPLAKDRPSEAKYFVPPAGARARFTAGAMPVIAYLDTGIYCHPIVDGLVEAVKIGYYNPPDMRTSRTAIDSIAELRRAVRAGAADAEVSDVEDVDQCDYDLVADDDFVLGADPGRGRRLRRRRLARHRLQVRALGGARAGPARAPGRAPSTTSPGSTRAGSSQKGRTDGAPVTADPAAASL